jgi:cell division protein FtsB
MKWGEYFKSPDFWVGRLLLWLLFALLGGSIKMPKFSYVGLTLSTIVIIMLLLKQLIFDKQNSNYEKGWYKTITKHIVLLYGVSISTLLISLINIDFIKSYITNKFDITNEYFIFKWTVQIIISLIIILICFGSNCFFKTMKKLWRNINEYRKYPELKQKNDVLSQQNRQLQNENKALNDNATLLKNNIKALEKEKCKYENCEKHKIVSDLLKYKEREQVHG